MPAHFIAFPLRIGTYTMIVQMELTVGILTSGTKPMVQLCINLKLGFQTTS